MKEKGEEGDVPLWVWIFVLLSLLWAGIYYLGFSLPSHLG